MKRSSLTSGKESILVVDSDPGVLVYTKNLLETAEYRVTTATCGSHAIELLQSGAKPDLILLELAMPGLEGLRTLEVCRRSRSQQKIVVHSSITTPQVVAEAMRLGALDYITKPFHKADIDAVLDRWR